MSRTEYIKDAVNFVMMVRGLPYHTSSWVKQHESEDPEILIKNALPEILGNDGAFCGKCLEDFLEYLKENPQASDEF